MESEIRLQTTRIQIVIQTRDALFDSVSSLIVFDSLARWAMYGLRRGQIGLAKLGVGGSYEEPSMPDWFYGHAIVEKKELGIKTHSTGIWNLNMMMFSAAIASISFWY